MAIIYRTAGPWGAGKGANLVPGEVDGNFYDVNRRLLTVEGEMPLLISIAFFSVSGSSFYIHMTNGTIQGPYQLPQQAWNFRGPWIASTSYYVNDVVTGNGGVYMVLMNHISGPVFDPNTGDGAGHDYYGLLLTNPGNVLPDGGITGQILAKTSDVDYEVDWLTPTVFPSQRILEAPDSTYSLTLINIASYVRCVNASGCTIIIPVDSTLKFPVGVEISFRQCTGSGIQLVPETTGVVLNPISGLSAKTARNGAVITAKKIAANTWDVFGLLTA
jgi:hypothetical protein